MSRNENVELFLPEFGSPEFFNLVDLFLELSLLKTAAGRERLVADLPPAIRYNIPNYNGSTGIGEISQLLKVCAENKSKWDDLWSIVSFYEKGTLPLITVEKYLADFHEQQVKKPITTSQQIELLQEYTATEVIEKGNLKQVVWCPVKDKTILASSTTSGKIYLWDFQDKQAMSYKPLPVGKGSGRTKPEYGNLAWSANGRWLAVGREKPEVHLWNFDDFNNPAWLEPVNLTKREPLPNLSVNALAWLSDNRLALGIGKKVYIYRLGKEQGSARFEYEREEIFSNQVYSLLWLSRKNELLVGQEKGVIENYKIDERTIFSVNPPSQKGVVNNLSLSPGGNYLIAGSSGKTVEILDAHSYRSISLIEDLEGQLTSIAFWTENSTTENRLLVATRSTDGTLQIWSHVTTAKDKWQKLYKKTDRISHNSFCNLAFHPTKSWLAAPVNDARQIQIWQFDVETIENAFATQTYTAYRNAKIVMVGESGVGKTALAKALCDFSYSPTESTHGRSVYNYSTEFVSTIAGWERHEILLWDLAGQPGYRLTHQIQLAQTNLALVVFDARNEFDIQDSLEYWISSLNHATNKAKNNAGNQNNPCQILLVAARTDRAGPPISSGRISELIKNYPNIEYFEVLTSAKHGWGIQELKERIYHKLSGTWLSLTVSNLPSEFSVVRRFLREYKQTQGARLLLTINELWERFQKDFQQDIDKPEFEKMVELLERTGQVRRLNFNNFILLEPELLDSYVAALVNAALIEPDELGTISRQRVLDGDFNIPPDVKNRLSGEDSQTAMLLATLDEVLDTEIAIREEVSDSLIFPSRILRRASKIWEDAETRKYKIYKLKGAAQNVYSVVVTRLSYSDYFRRKAIWRNQAVFTSSRVVGNEYLLTFETLDNGEGNLTIYYRVTSDPEALREADKIAEALREADKIIQEQLSIQETRDLSAFNGFVAEQLHGTLPIDSIEEIPIVRCTGCGYVPDNKIIQQRLARGKTDMNCPICDTSINLLNDSQAGRSQPGKSVQQDIYYMEQSVQLARFGFDEEIKELAQDLLEQVTPSRKARRPKKEKKQT